MFRDAVLLPQNQVLFLMKLVFNYVFYHAKIKPPGLGSRPASVFFKLHPRP